MISEPIPNLDVRVYSVRPYKRYLSIWPIISWDTMKTLCLHESVYHIPHQIRKKFFGTV